MLTPPWHLPDPPSDIFRGPCTPTLWFVFPIGLMRLITVRYFCHFIWVTWLQAPNIFLMMSLTEANSPVCPCALTVLIQLLSTSVLALNYEYELNCQEESRVCKFISKWRIISLWHSSILWRIWLNFMALFLVFIQRLFQFSHFFPISNFFGLSITEETWVVEMRIWCMKIVNILVLR
jgi:hypothetical protein